MTRTSRHCWRTSTCSPVVRRLLAGLTVTAALSGTGALSGTALANSRYPQAGQIAADPGDNDHLLVRTTYGLLQTVDAGKTWTWICETAVGYEDNSDPFVALGKTGVVVVATGSGLSLSPDRGCAWSRPAGALGTLQAIDLVADRKNPLKMLALVQDPDELAKNPESVTARLAASQDGGLTWAYVGKPLPSDFVALTLELAAAAPQRVYVSGLSGGPAKNQSVVQRSDDGGEIWLELPLNATDVAGDFLSAVDPLDADRVFVRRNREGAQALLVSPDAGKTWQEVFVTPGNLFGFALSPDGNTVALGVTGPGAGIWTSDSHALKFTRKSEGDARCLTWTPSGLYVCGNEDDPSAAYMVGVSHDGGANVETLHLRKDVTPLKCPAGTRTGNECPKYWPQVAFKLGITAPDGTDVTPAKPAAPKQPSGCAAGGGNAGAWLALASLALTAWAVRRRVGR